MTQVRAPNLLGKAYLDNDKLNSTESSQHKKSSTTAYTEKYGSDFTKPSIRQGELITNGPVYVGKIQVTDLPDHALNEHDF